MSRNLLAPLSEWHYEISCCRDAILTIRVFELAYIIINSIVSVLFIKVLMKVKVCYFSF